MNEDENAAHQQRRNVDGHDHPVQAQRVREHVETQRLNDGVDRIQQPDSQEKPIP